MTVIKGGGRVRDGDLRHAWQVVERACCWWRYKARDWSAESGVWPRRGLLPVTSRPARAQMTWRPRRALYPITARPSWWLRTLTSVRTLWFHFAGAQSQAHRHRGLPANAQSSCPTVESRHVGRTESATVCGSPVQSQQYAGYRKFA